MAKKSLTVTLYLSELLYDIQNKTYLTGRSRSTGDNYQAVANMQANEDEENENQILRSLSNAFAALRIQLSEYISQAEVFNISNALMQKSNNIQLTLSMPSNFDNSAVDLVSSALHQYLVNVAIGDWFAITNRDDATIYISRAASNVEELKVAIGKRVRPTRNSNFM